MAERDQSFYTRFKDRTMSAAQKRGALVATWDDVLSVAANVPETREVLTDQGISLAGLSRDIQYSLHFGRPRLSVNSALPATFPDLYSRVVGELQRDLQIYTESQEFLSDPDGEETTETFMGFLNEYLDDKKRIVTDPEGFELAEMKAKILRATMTGFIEQFQPTFAKAPNPNIPQNMQPMVQVANQVFTAEVLDKFGSFALKKRQVIVAEDQPLLIFDIADKRGEGITPFQIIDTAQQVVDPFLRYVLYRNGLIAPEGYEAPCSMPSPTIISHALHALNFVEDSRQQKVQVVHLLPGLLQDPEVLRLLSDLDAERNISEKEEESPMGFLFSRRSAGYSRNFIKFYNIMKASLAPEREGDDVFRFHPEITEGLRDFLKQSEQVVTNGPRTLAAARLFGELIKQKEVRSILMKAGLTAKQLKRWPSVLKNADKKRVKEERVVKDKTETAFKIDDKQLEDLLDEYGSERSKLALEGKLDPVIGREEELSKMIRILLQRGKSNPLLLGEAGVGKTVLFDGLALRIASGNMPRSLIGARVITIDLSAMNSGAMFRGQFEERLLPIIKGVAERNARGDKPPIILCIDELHAAMKAGSAMNTPGAGELLKPMLARGELSIVGATTQADYARYIEGDGALNRRFEPIFIEAPMFNETVSILNGLKEAYGKYHKIEFPSELIPTLVRLTDRYLDNLNQPDKAISILDAACAYARMKEKDAVDQGTIIEVIAATAKLDPRFLQENEGARYLQLKRDLPREVLGQDEAMDIIANALIVAKADLHDPKKPLGQFLLLGPTGVGKTETARALARILFGTEEALIRIDMSNYGEKHEDSRLVGAPPGYVGYGEEGELTGAVRRKPYAVVLLDEIEKAHPEVFKRLLAVLEEGELRDSRGRTVSFRNTIILMTSNLGVEDAQKAYRNRGTFFRNADVPWRKATHPQFERAVKEHFPPEFLNRIDGQIIYDPLSELTIHELVGREISALSKRLDDRWGLTLDISQAVYEQLAKDGYSDEYGARFLKRTVKSQLITPLAIWVLQNEDRLQRGGVVEVPGLGSDFSPKIRQS